MVNIWDGANKKRLTQIFGYPTSVAALAFNSSTSLLAVASSYAFEQARQYPFSLCLACSRGALRWGPGLLRRLLGARDLVGAASQPCAPTLWPWLQFAKSALPLA